MSDSPHEMVVVIPTDQRIKYRVTPLPGRFMAAKAIGGQLEALADLHRVLGREMEPPAKMTTLIIGITMDDNGSIEFELAIMEEKTRAEVEASIALEKEGAGK